MFGDKPLFTRGQLSLVMVGATLAIALLANLNTGPDRPEVRRQEVAGVAVYWSPAFDKRPYVLVQVAMPESDLLVVDTVVQQLLTRLPPEVEPRRYHDRWELLLPGTPADLPPLLTRLGEPLDPPRWQQLGQRERARRYLEGSLPGAALNRDDAGFGLRAQAFHQQLLTRGRLSLSFTGITLDSGPAPWKTAVSGLPEGEAGAVGTAAGESNAGRVRLVAGRTDPGFARAALALQLLGPLAEARGVKWRFLPGADSSRLDLEATPQALESLRRDLALLGPEQVEAARTRLVQTLETALEEPRSYARQQGVQAFYRLALDYWPRFIATIAALPAEAPLELLHSWLAVPATGGADDDQKTETGPGRGA